MNMKPHLILDSELIQHTVLSYLNLLITVFLNINFYSLEVGLKLCIDTAIHNFRWLKITLIIYFKYWLPVHKCQQKHRQKNIIHFDNFLTILQIYGYKYLALQCGTDSEGF